MAKTEWFYSIFGSNDCVPSIESLCVQITHSDTERKREHWHWKCSFFFYLFFDMNHTLLPRYHTMDGIKSNGINCCTKRAKKIKTTRQPAVCKRNFYQYTAWFGLCVCVSVVHRLAAVWCSPWDIRHSVQRTPPSYRRQFVVNVLPMYNMNTFCECVRVHSCVRVRNSIVIIQTEQSTPSNFFATIEISIARF